MISLQAPDIRDTGVAIDCELNPDLPVAFANATQIQQVLFNLLSDACETMGRSEEAKKLTLRTYFTDDRVSLEVENNGSCVTSVKPLLEVVVADNHGERSWPWPSVILSSRRKEARSKLFNEEEV